jgi:hypothetical protein
VDLQNFSSNITLVNNSTLEQELYLSGSITDHSYITFQMIQHLLHFQDQSQFIPILHFKSLCTYYFFFHVSVNQTPYGLWQP